MRRAAKAKHTATAAPTAVLPILKLWPLMAALMVYMVIVTPLAQRHRQRLSPDAVCYIQRAKYLAQGDFYHSISGYWSPMVSWCITPLVAGGMDGLYAARTVMCIWGAIYLIGFDLLLRRLLKIGNGWRCGALLVMALAICAPAVKQITPDLMMGAWVLFYLAVLAGENVFNSRWQALLAGVLAGAAFMAKAYALPFLGIHLIFTVILRSVVQWRAAAAAARQPPLIPQRRLSEDPSPCPFPGIPGRGEKQRGSVVGLRRHLIWLTTAGLTLALVSGAWIGVLSWRYGHFTISTSGSRAHAMVGPKDQPREPAEYWGAPPDPYISRNELPETQEFGFWSPLHSTVYFRHQVDVMANHSVRILLSIRDFDLLYLSPFSILVVGAVLLRLGRMKEGKWAVVWLVGTALLFCSGLLMVYYISRYTLPILLPVGILVCLLLADRLELGGYRPGAGGSWRIVRWIVCAVVLASFAAAAIGQIHTLWREPSATSLYRVVAEELHRNGITGPISSPDRHNGIYLAYHADMKFMGFPPQNDVDQAERELLASRCGVLVLWNQAKPDRAFAAAGKIAEQLGKRPKWKTLMVIRLSRQEAATIVVPVQTPLLYR